MSSIEQALIHVRSLNGSSPREALQLANTTGKDELINYWRWVCSTEDEDDSYVLGFEIHTQLTDETVDELYRAGLFLRQIFNVNDAERTILSSELDAQAVKERIATVTEGDILIFLFCFTPSKKQET